MYPLFEGQKGPKCSKGPLFSFGAFSSLVLPSIFTLSTYLVVITGEIYIIKNLNFKFYYKNGWLGKKNLNKYNKKIIMLGN